MWPCCHGLVEGGTRHILAKKSFSFLFFGKEDTRGYCFSEKECNDFYVMFVDKKKCHYMFSRYKIAFVLI